MEGSLSRGRAAPVLSGARGPAPGRSRPAAATLGAEKTKDGVTLPRLSSVILEPGIEAMCSWGGPAG